MARKTFAEHMAINGTAFNPATFQGGRIAPLANLFVGSAHERDSDGSSQTAWLNMLDGIAELARNTAQCNVYKDSSDTALQFSVEAFDCWYGSILCSYAGAVNLTGLSAGGTRFIYADLSNAPAVTITAAAGWPTTIPFLRLGAIAAPASGHWLPTNLTPHVAPQCIASRSLGLYIYKLAFVYNSGATTPLVVVPAVSRVLWAAVDITTVFNGSSPTVKIGDSGVNDRHLTTATAAPTVLGWKKSELGYLYAAQGTINLYIGGSGASTGAGTAYVGVAA